MHKRHLRPNWSPTSTSASSIPFHTILSSTDCANFFLLLHFSHFHPRSWDIMVAGILVAFDTYIRPLGIWAHNAEAGESWQTLGIALFTASPWLWFFDQFHQKDQQSIETKFGEMQFATFFVGWKNIVHWWQQILFKFCPRMTRPSTSQIAAKFSHIRPNFRNYKFVRTLQQPGGGGGAGR